MKTIIKIAPSELNGRGLWERYCEMSGTNVWAMKEGLLDPDEELYLTEEESIKLGLIDKKS